jgi:hypothetical protein
MKMKHQFQLGTQSGIVSKEAAAQIRAPINDLARTVNGLDALGTNAINLDTRRHNLMTTIASLEDRLGSIEKMRSRK